RLDRFVERGDRLVEDHHARPGGQRAGDIDALLLPAGQLVRIARPEQFRIEPDLAQRVPGDLARRRFFPTLDERTERHRITDRHARIERSVGILEYHLHLPAQGIDADPVWHVDGVAVEHQLAGIRGDEMQQQARQGRLAAARLPDDAQGLALLNIERYAVNRLDRFAAAALDRDMLFQVACDEHRLRGPAPVSWINGMRVKDRHMRIDDGHRYIRTSIAARNPSLTRLKQIEVTKIAAPGSAQTNGTT